MTHLTNGMWHYVILGAGSEGNRAASALFGRIGSEPPVDSVVYSPS